MEGRIRPREEDVVRLLGTVREMAEELRPGLGLGGGLSLEQSLERDLGMDSLARMELFHRVEQEFGVALPESVMAQTETPHDLLIAIGTAGQRAAPARPVATPGPAGGARAAPASLSTLTEVLAWHAEHHGSRSHIHLIDGDARSSISYGELWQGAERCAAGLLAQDVQPGQAVAIMLPTGADYFFSFMGTLLAGANPVPIYPPARPSQMEEHLKLHAGILDNCQAQQLIAEPAAREFRAIVTPAELAAASPGAPLPRPHATDTALLQYTSGSTGDPKGVVLSHQNLLANIRAMGQTLGVGPEDVFVSWLPLYHDMGLIGAWLGSLVHGMPLALMSPLSFLARPGRWLAAIDEFGGTISGGPNFAYEACLKRIGDDELKGLDLSSWRIAFNGAEPVSPRTMEEFAKRFAPIGFERNSLMAVYGLAENSLGVSFPPPGRGPRTMRINLQHFMKTGQARPAPKGAPDPLDVPSCGPPMPGHEVRILDGAAGEAAEGQEGRVQFRGPSSSSGYFRNAPASEALFVDGWLDSGDLGFLVEGELHITGRAKDVIVKAGRNIFPAELEDAVGGLEGVQKGAVAVFASNDPETNAERLVVMAETRRRGEAELEEIRRRVMGLSVDLLGTPPDGVELVPPRTVPKTTSGKIRRQAARAIFEGAGPGRSQSRPRNLRRYWCNIALKSHGLWAWCLLAVLAPPVWLAMAAFPYQRWGWGVARAAFGLVRALLGARIKIEGLEHLPASGAFLICVNHGSYLDGPALILALPRPAGFVVKSELRGSIFTRVFLERLGALFVERFDVTQGISDARAATEAVRAGHSLVYFPEGTFTRQPGLLPFQMGAFTTAVDAELPVIPVTLSGSRAMLRDKTWLPRPGIIRVRIGQPIQASDGDGDPWARAVALRDGVRNEILAHLGEPDLAGDFLPLAGKRREPKQ